jgi:cupin 2 domain-containing protein
MAIARGNLFVACEPPASGERFETVATLSDVHVERIVSSCRPDSAPYDQPQDEWVVLLTGDATLEVAGESLELCAGDHVLLPAHTPHRVLRTSHGAHWLAVHVPRR